MNNSVKKAVENYYIRQAKKDAGPSRKNNSPEKEVEKQITQWLSSQNIFHKIVESKAVLSSQYSGYRKGQADAGFPDIVGLVCTGHFLAIELKAPGRRSSLKNHQRDFLHSVIQSQGFGCVTDSLYHLSPLLSSWLSLTCPLERQALLRSDLPKKRAEPVDSAPLFED